MNDMTNAPTAGDGWLDQMVGDWTFEGRAVPDRTDGLQTGTERITRRGVWLIIEGDDYRFQLTLDPETGRASGDFVHWAHPLLWTYDGAVEADGKLHLRSRGPDMEGKGADTEYDDVFEIVSPDERRSAGRVKEADGTWRDFSRTVYRRVGAAR